MTAKILFNSSGVTDNNSISALNGSPSPELMFSLPRPAEKTAIGTSDINRATVIFFNFELSTIPPLKFTYICNNKNNINYLELQAHNTHYIRKLCGCMCLLLHFNQAFY